MISLDHLEIGGKAIVQNLPENLEIKQLLLTHGIHPGKMIRLLQSYASQDLSLITCNGRKLALRRSDLSAIRVEQVYG